MKTYNKVTPPRSGNQPGLTGTEKVYGSKLTPTIRVRLKGGEREMLIRESDFDADRYERV